VRAPWLPPKTSTTCASSSRPKRASRVEPREPRAGAGIGRPTTRTFPFASAGVGEERAACTNGVASRFRGARGGAFRLGQRGRDAAEPGGDEHRPPDVAAATEHDGPAGGGSRMRRQRERAPPPRARNARRSFGPGPAGGSPRCGRRRTRTRAQERAAPRRDPATRRTSLPPRARGALPRPRATARRDPPLPPARDQTPELPVLCHDHGRC